MFTVLVDPEEGQFAVMTGGTLDAPELTEWMSADEDLMEFAVGGKNYEAAINLDAGGDGQHTGEIKCTDDGMLIPATIVDVDIADYIDDDADGADDDEDEDETDDETEDEDADEILEGDAETDDEEEVETE